MLHDLLKMVPLQQSCNRKQPDMEDAKITIALSSQTLSYHTEGIRIKRKPLYQSHHTRVSRIRAAHHVLLLAILSNRLEEKIHHLP